MMLILNSVDFASSLQCKSFMWPVEFYFLHAHAMHTWQDACVEAVELFLGVHLVFGHFQNSSILVISCDLACDMGDC